MSGLYDIKSSRLDMALIPVVDSNFLTSDLIGEYPQTSSTLSLDKYVEK